jgi:tetratricopeptide (TPR) repeat protein
MNFLLNLRSIRTDGTVTITQTLTVSMLLTRIARVTDVPEKPRFRSRMKVPALIATALVCSLTGFFLSNHFLTPTAPGRESFPSEATNFTRQNLTQPELPSPTIQEEAANLPPTQPGDFPTDSTDDQTDLHNPPGADPEAPPVVTASDSIASHLTVADAHLRSGNLWAALRIYNMLKEDADGPIPAAVQFRLALTAEAFGDYTAALTDYESLLNNHSAANWVSVALYGRARCLDALGRIDLLARDVLPLVTLDDQRLPREVRHEMTHLLARAMLPFSRHIDANDLLDDEVIAVPFYRVDANLLLDDLNRDVRPLENRPQPPQYRIIQAVSESAENIYLQISMPPAAIPFAVTEICRRCGLDVQFSQAARLLAADRKTSIDTDDRSLALLLDGLTIPYGLTWMQDETTITVQSTRELGKAAASHRLRVSAERLQRTALLEAPDSRQASFTRIALGGLLFNEQKLADAAHMFSLTLEEQTRGRIRAETAFNLGKCQLKLLEPQSALESFLLGQDASVGSPDVRFACHMYGARVQMLLGQQQSAVRTMRRALQLAKDHDVEPQAALMLSSAYLMAGSSPGANNILMARRELFEEPSDRSAAAFLSALSRFRAAVLEKQKTRAAEAVVNALGNLRPADQFGEHWHVLAAEACNDIGLMAPARVHWKSALQQLGEVPLKAYIVSQLAEIHRAEHNYDEASSLLALAPREVSSPISDTLLLQSARVALQRGAPQETVDHCLEVLQRADDEDTQRRGLALLGSAYERMGNHLSAMYCFAGMLEEAVASDLKQRTMPATGAAQ